MKQKQDIQSFILTDLLEAAIPTENILKLLARVDDEFFIKAHRLILNDDNKSVVKLIDFLTECYQDHKDAVYTLLETLNNSEANFGQILAEKHDFATTQYFLEFLVKLIASGIDAKKILALFQVKNTSGWSLGTIITHKYLDTSIIQTFLGLMDNLLKRDLNPTAIIEVLQITSKDNSTPGHFIALRQINVLAQKYLILLADCLKRGASTESVMTLLQIETIKGWKTGHFISEYQKEYVKQEYIKLLIICLRKGHPGTEVYDLLMSKIPAGNVTKNFLSRSVHNLNPVTIYLLIRTKLLLENDYKSLSQYKEIVLNYILSLPLNVRIRAVKHTLDENYPLGKFFGFTNTDFEASDFLLNKIENEMRSWRPLNTRSSTASIFSLMPVYIPIHVIKNTDLRQKTIDTVLQNMQRTQKIEHLSQDMPSSKRTIGFGTRFNKEFIFPGSDCVDGTNNTNPVIPVM